MNVELVKQSCLEGKKVCRDIHLMLQKNLWRKQYFFESQNLYLSELTTNFEYIDFSAVIPLIFRINKILTQNKQHRSKLHTRDSLFN